MKAKTDCIACLFKQALNTARLVTDDPAKLLAVVDRVTQLAAHPCMEQTPAALSKPVYDIVAEVCGVQDPFAAAKRHSNELALGLVPEMEAWIAASKDPLDTALHLAAAGNVIDLGIGDSVDIEQDLRAMLSKTFVISVLDAFRAKLQPGAKLLYLGDNAGEIVFDTLLVKQLLTYGVQVTFVVKSAPIINDATREDAEVAGMTRLVPVIETGSDDIGVHWDHVTEEFRRAFEAADLVIGKGHGNFETCNDRSGKFFFLLKAKCLMVAQELGVKLGDMVFTRGAACA